jgi:hypothetical protein
MSTRRPQRGLRLCRRCALHRRGNIPRLDQILGATKYDKLSDRSYVHLHLNRLVGLDGTAESRVLGLLSRIREGLAAPLWRLASMHRPMATGRCPMSR